MSDDDALHLFIPGPAGSTDEVVAATGRRIVPHYGDEFVADYNRCIDLFKTVFQTRNDLFLIVGPGTAAIDAALASALADGARVLVPTCGFFGKRIGDMCRAHRATVDVLEFPIGTAVDADVVRRHLAASDHPYDMVAWVHHETSSGVLNPVESIAAAAADHGALTLLDAVASMGGVEMPVDAWGIDLCVSVANKCLGAPPGLAPISVSPRAWKAIDANSESRSWYLDLRTWRQYRQNWPAWHPYPTTVASNVVEAINVSLEQILDEGLEARIRRTAEAADMTRAGLRRMGFELFTDDADASPVTTSALAHPDLAVADMQQFLLQRSIYISGGLGDLAGKIFRIGHMGTVITRSEVQLLLDAIAAALADADVTY